MAKRKQAALGTGQYIKIVPKGVQPTAPQGKIAGKAEEGHAQARCTTVFAHPDVAEVFAENSRLRADNMHLRGRLALLENRLGERQC